MKTSTVNELLSELGVEQEEQMQKSASASDIDLNETWANIIAAPYSEETEMEVQDYEKMAATEEVLEKMAWAAASDSLEYEDAQFQKESGSVYARGIYDGYMAKLADLQGAAPIAMVGTDAGNPHAQRTVMTPNMSRAPYGTNVLNATGGRVSAPASPGQVINTGKKPYQAAQTTGVAPGQF